MKQQHTNSTDTLKWSKTDQGVYVLTITGSPDAETFTERHAAAFPVTFTITHNLDHGMWVLREDEEIVKAYTLLREAKAAAKIGAAAEIKAQEAASSKAFWAAEAQAYDFAPGDVEYTVLDDCGTSGTMVRGYGFVPAGQDVKVAQEQAHINAKLLDKIDTDPIPADDPWLARADNRVLAEAAGIVEPTFKVTDKTAGMVVFTGSHNDCANYIMHAGEAGISMEVTAGHEATTDEAFDPSRIHGSHFVAQEPDDTTRAIESFAQDADTLAGCLRSGDVETAARMAAILAPNLENLREYLGRTDPDEGMDDAPEPLYVDSRRKLGGSGIDPTVPVYTCPGCGIAVAGTPAEIIDGDGWCAICIAEAEAENEEATARLNAAKVAAGIKLMEFAPGDEVTIEDDEAITVARYQADGSWVKVSHQLEVISEDDGAITVARYQADGSWVKVSHQLKAGPSLIETIDAGTLTHEYIPCKDVAGRCSLCGWPKANHPRYHLVTAEGPAPRDTLTDAEYKAALEEARSQGHDAGQGADGPCDLSGQWADEPSGPQVIARIISAIGADPERVDGAETDILDVYEDAYNLAAAPEPPACPVCGGPSLLTGDLGRLRHFNCRSCGIDFNQHIHTGETELVEADDPLIMCEICGQDILQSTANWHEATETDGRVPLCDECHAANPNPEEES